MGTAEMRRRVEREIVRRFVDDALAAGYRLAVSLERGFDLDEMLLGSTDPQRIMDEAFADDDCHLFVQPQQGPTTEEGAVVSLGWVYLVFGNDGWDVVCDYSANERIESLLSGAHAIAASYA